MFGAGQKRPGDLAAERRLAADRGGAEARAVEGVPERQGLEAAGGGAGDLHRDFDRVGAAGGEQHLGGPGGERAEALGQFDARLRW